MTSDCGNGVSTSGQYITGNDPTDTSMRAGASFVAKWVGYLDTKYGGAAVGGVRFYQLDNEPDIWFATHRDVHPAGATYTEMLRKTESVAAAQVFGYGQADPSAIVHGPAQVFSNGSAMVTFPAYSITEFVVPASGLAPGVAHLPRATSAPTASARIPAARPGPVAGFLRATGFRGRKVASGWSPEAWDPKAPLPPG